MVQFSKKGLQSINLIQISNNIVFKRNNDQIFWDSDLHLLHIISYWPNLFIVVTLTKKSTGVLVQIGCQNITIVIQIYNNKIKLDLYLPNSKQVQTNKRTMLLFNHRTQGDFFIHDVVSQYSANFLARWMVAVAFPMLAIFQQLCTQSVWFFKRGGNDLNTFFKWIDNKFDKATRPNLLVYPEGHRMHESDKVGKMKTGMLQYAYDRKIDTQIIIVLGIEKGFNEKKFHASLGPTQISIKVDEIIKPDQFSNFEQFVEYIQEMFKKNFEETYDYQYKKP